MAEHMTGAYFSKTALTKYGHRADHRKCGWSSTLTNLSKVASTKITITSDSHKMYLEQIRKKFLQLVTCKS